MTPTNTDRFYVPVFVARQPVFDRDEKIFAYELLFRDGSAARTANFRDPDQATAKVVADGFAVAMETMLEKRRVLINFTEGQLRAKTALALPRDICVVEILETTSPAPEVLDACRELKEAGYLLALDDFVGQPEMEPFLELADIVKVDVLGLSTQEIISLTRSLRRRKVKLLAEKIEDDLVYRLTRALGYAYFQGYFFSKPEIVEGRKLPAGAISKVQILGRLADPDYDPKKVGAIIARDAGLTHRLLKHIHSASFSQYAKVGSVAQAVLIMGQTPLRQWLMAVTLSDLAAAPRTQELAFGSLQRAKFLETMAGAMPQPVASQEGAFLLGLLSRLDALLGAPMETITRELALDETLAAALRGEDVSLTPLLTLVRSVEAADWNTEVALLGELGLAESEAAAAYAAASAWAAEILGLTA